MPIKLKIMAATPRFLEPFPAAAGELILAFKSLIDIEVSGKPKSALAKGQPKAPPLLMRLTWSESLTIVVSSALTELGAGLQVKVISTGRLFSVPKKR